jgi:hypothetical protein
MAAVVRSSAAVGFGDGVARGFATSFEPHREETTAVNASASATATTATAVTSALGARMATR